MGLFGFKSKKQEDISFDDNSNLGLEDPFKQDPFMNLDSGLNLPKDDGLSNSQNPYFQNQNQNQRMPNQNPFQKYNQQEQRYSEPTYNQAPIQNVSTNHEKDLQIIIAKLDALRAEVQSINHRLENIEQKQQKKMW